jgi:hypothetical protein
MKESWIATFQHDGKAYVRAHLKNENGYSTRTFFDWSDARWWITQMGGAA